MALPQIAIPEFTTTRPSNGEIIRFRPFLVKEEKVLLIAAEAKDFASIGRAIKQIVQACVLTPRQDVATWPFFDLEHLFIQIRAKSVGEKITLRYHHAEGVNRAGQSCSATTEVEVNLDQVRTSMPAPEASLIQIDEQMWIKLRYPTLDVVTSLMTLNKENTANTANKADTTATTTFSSTAVFDVLADSIESVTHGETVSTPDNKQDALRFLEALPVSVVKDIEIFFKSMPKASCTVIYTCKQCGQSDTIQLSGLQDFF